MRAVMNPVLRELGFSPNDRVVVVHADDVGMCHATLPAIQELLSFGFVTSASAMVPCPWFPDVVALKQRQPAFDLGVHITLTSEWEGYRWGPVSTPSRAAGLTDDRGYLHRTTAAVRSNTRRGAAREEMQSQVDHAEKMGLAPTHIDCHMFAAMCVEFQEDYLQIGLAKKIPAFLRRDKSVGEREWIARRAAEWDRRAQPVFDGCEIVTRAGSEVREEQVREMFHRLPAGLSCVLLHPAIDTPEIRHITGDWRSRVADFDAFRSPRLRNYVSNLGIQLISYQPLCDAMRSRLRDDKN